MNTIDLQLFINHLRYGVVIANPNGKILVKNPVFDILFSKGQKEDLFLIFKDNPLLIDSVKKVLVLRGSYFLRDIEIKVDGAEIKKMNVDTYPLTDSHGILIGVILLFQDSQGGIHFEEQQKREDRIRYLKTIASGLAHEIKNPLSGIGGASQLLANALQDNAELKEYAEIIRKETIRVDQLIKNLTNFTKPRSLNKVPTNINQILHDLIVLQKTVSQSKIEFVEIFDPSLPLIHADSQALSQIFLNFIKNARQAIQKSGKITVQARMVTDSSVKKGGEKKKMIAVDIEDTGEGIREEVLSTLFIPFYTTKPQGTGLGLALCHQLIEEHGGDIKVESQVGKGTKFTVYLPV